VHSKPAKQITDTVACPNCGGDKFERGDGKPDAMLYMHCTVDDPAGHQIIPMIQQLRLNGFVGVPENMAVGKGVPDEQLNLYYNAFDVFTLPTGGEGWGLPILEAMSAGCPVLVTDYSAHVQYVHECW
jgi:glycosyltransferase involved in cell wall biosynthesis